MIELVSGNCSRSPLFFAWIEFLLVESVIKQKSVNEFDFKIVKNESANHLDLHVFHGSRMYVHGAKNKGFEPRVISLRGGKLVKSNCEKKDVGVKRVDAGLNPRNTVRVSTMR